MCVHGSASGCDPDFHPLDPFTAMQALSRCKLLADFSASFGTEN
jgi:hypothetical protein